VLEPLKDENDTIPVKYDYAKIANWKINADYTGSNQDTTGNDNAIISAKMTDIATYTQYATKLLEANYAFTTRLLDFYKHITRVNVAINTYRPETFKNIEKIYSAYETHLTHRAMYDTYIADVNELAKRSANMGALLSLI
jgi:hypothetical protein